MEIVLSGGIKQNTKKRVLICGDSFFYDSRNRFPGLHWSQRLPPHLEITNVAQGGASNTMILDQFIEYFDSHDVVIFGFTSPWRLEFPVPDEMRHEKFFKSKWLTSCSPTRLNHRQRKLDDDFRELIQIDAHIVRHCGLAIAAIEMARQVATVHYSLGATRPWLEDLCRDYPDNLQLPRYLHGGMPFNLTDYYNSDEYQPYRHLDGTDSHPPFHVHLPEIQQRFADQVCEFVDNA